MKKKTHYMVDREFCEKVLCFLDHSTDPMMDIFQGDIKAMRVVIDYNSQADKIRFTFFEEKHTDRPDSLMFMPEGSAISLSDAMAPKETPEPDKENKETVQDIADKIVSALVERGLTFRETSYVIEGVQRRKRKMDKKRDDRPDTTKIYGHYGVAGDYERIKSGKLGAIDIHIVREEELKQLTADMAGFGMAKSQRVIIDYDKGYGWAIVKRIIRDHREKRT